MTMSTSTPVLACVSRRLRGGTEGKRSLVISANDSWTSTKATSSGKGAFGRMPKKNTAGMKFKNRGKEKDGQAERLGRSRAPSSPFLQMPGSV